MTPKQQFEELKGQIETLQKDLARAEGANFSLLERLKKEHSCSSVKEAKARILRLQEELKEKERAFQKALEKFKHGHGNRILSPEAE